jgi:hypothetical protein
MSLSNVIVELMSLSNSGFRKEIGRNQKVMSLTNNYRESEREREREGVAATFHQLMV